MSLEADVGKPLLEVLREVVLDPVEQAAFTNDPSAYLGQYGYEDVPADDLAEAFGLVADTLPPDVAQAVAATAPTVPPSPVDQMDDPGGLGADPDGGFGEVTPDFDALSAGALGDGPDLDDDLDGDFGTGEVAAVAEVGDGFAGGDDYDDDAFGEGSEVAEHPGGYDDSPVDADDIGLDDLDPGGYDDGALDPDGGVPGDTDTGDTDDGGGFGDELPDALPDDPGDFLDDIGSF